MSVIQEPADSYRILELLWKEPRLKVGGSSGGNMNDFIINVLPAQGPIIPTWVPIFGSMPIGIIAQFLIAVIALFGVYIAYWVTRYTIGPKLDIRFIQNDLGLCHKTRNSILKNNELIWVPDYYFRFYVENTGKSMAKHCEIIIEKLWLKEGQKYEQYQRFAPMNLRWTGGKRGIIDINPGRTAIGNIGHIPKIEYQNDLRERDPYSLIDLNGKGENPDETLERFIFELTQGFYAFPNCLAPGFYFIQIGLYSENAKTKKLYLEISWSGKWEPEERVMFKEIQMTKREAPPSEEYSL